MTYDRFYNLQIQPSFFHTLPRLLLTAIKCHENDEFPAGKILVEPLDESISTYLEPLCPPFWGIDLHLWVNKNIGHLGSRSVNDSTYSTYSTFGYGQNRSETTQKQKNILQLSIGRKISRLFFKLRYLVPQGIKGEVYFDF